MSQKKCPKCGEANPAEAVMCWACYTPLAGGAVAAPHATAPAGQNANEGTTKTAVAPWQIGVIGVALLAAAVVGGSTLMGGSTSSSTDTTNYAAPIRPPDIYPSSGQSIVPYDPGTSAPSISAPIPPAQPTTTGEMLFTVSVPPKAGVAWGTMAIIPSGTASGQNPASLAKAACQQAVSGGKWDGLYVYVFSDADSAQTFRLYQSQRGGQPLDRNDYSTLQALWSRVPIRYEYSNGREFVRYPSKNPGGWWDGKSNFHPAKT